jgi:hypothetical protein
MCWPKSVISTPRSEVSLEIATDAIQSAKLGLPKPLIGLIHSLAVSVTGHPWEQMFCQQQPLVVRKMVSCLQKRGGELPTELLLSMRTCMQAAYKSGKFCMRPQIEIRGERGQSIYVDRLLFKLAIYPSLPSEKSGEPSFDQKSDKAPCEVFETEFLSQTALDGLKKYIEEGVLGRDLPFGALVQLLIFASMVQDSSMKDLFRARLHSYQFPLTLKDILLVKLFAGLAETSVRVDRWREQYPESCDILIKMCMALSTSDWQSLRKRVAELPCDQSAGETLQLFDEHSIVGDLIREQILTLGSEPICLELNSIREVADFLVFIQLHDSWFSRKLNLGLSDEILMNADMMEILRSLPVDDLGFTRLRESSPHSLQSCWPGAVVSESTRLLTKERIIRVMDRSDEASRDEMVAIATVFAALEDPFHEFEPTLFLQLLARIAELQIPLDAAMRYELLACLQKAFRHDLKLTEDVELLCEHGVAYTNSTLLLFQFPRLRLVMTRGFRTEGPHGYEEGRTAKINLSNIGITQQGLDGLVFYLNQGTLSRSMPPSLCFQLMVIGASLGNDELRRQAYLLLGNGVEKMSVADICILGNLRTRLEQGDGGPSTTTQISFPSHPAETYLRAYLKACSKKEWKELFSVIETRRASLPGKELLESFADKGIVGSFLRSQPPFGERSLILQSAQDASYLLSFVREQQQAELVMKYFKKIKVLEGVCRDDRVFKELKSRLRLEFETIRAESICACDEDPSPQKHFFSEVLASQFPETLP